ncbi:hypothetical protein ACLOJK_027722 [Asimina triloba]
MGICYRIAFAFGFRPLPCTLPSRRHQIAVPLSLSLPPATPVTVARRTSPVAPLPLPTILILLFSLFQCRPCNIHRRRHPPATPVAVGPSPLSLSRQTSFSSSHSSHLPSLQHPSPSSFPSPSLSLPVFRLSLLVPSPSFLSATGDEVFDPRKEDFGLAAQNVTDYGFAGSVAVTDESMEEEGFALNLKTSGQFARPQLENSILESSVLDCRFAAVVVTAILSQTATSVCISLFLSHRFPIHRKLFNLMLSVCFRPCFRRSSLPSALPPFPGPFFLSPVPLPSPFPPSLETLPRRLLPPASLPCLPSPAFSFSADCCFRFAPPPPTPLLPLPSRPSTSASTRSAQRRVDLVHCCRDLVPDRCSGV